MKTILLLIAILSFNICIAQSLTLEGWIDPSIKTKCKCEICGKVIIKIEYDVYDGSKFILYGTDKSYYDDHILFYEDGKLSFYEQVRYIKNKKSIRVCKDCYEKYNEEINEKLDTLWNKIIKKIKAENKDKRIENEKLEKQKRLKEIDNKIKKLQNEILELKSKKNENNRN